MKGTTGTPMQGIEYAPHKKGNVYCRDCAHLAYGGGRAKARKRRGKAIDAVPNYHCEIKKQPRWYTARCYCKHFKHKEEI